MKSFVFVICIGICICNLVFAQVNNENLSTGINIPFCASILANDGASASIVSISNGTSGYTFRNYPDFFLANNSAANSYAISISAQNTQFLNYGNASVSSAYVSTGDSWSKTTYNSYPVVQVGPDDGSSAGNTNWGIAVGYNIAFYQPGTYSIWVFASSGFMGTYSDSFHILYQSPRNAAINFLSYNNPVLGYTNTFTWIKAPFTLTVTAADTAWPPSLFNFYLAMREDGIKVNQIVLTQSTSTSFTGTSYYSPLISCPASQVLYFPAKNFTGVDTFQYTVNNGSATYTSTATIYVGTPIPSPSVTPSRTPSPSASSSGTPSRTPSSSPTPSISASPSVTPSVSPSSSASSSPSVTPSATPSPSLTPSMTPSISVSPSTLASPSITPSVTPSNSPTPSITPTQSPSSSSSISPSPTPSTSATPSPSATASVTPTASITPSVSSSPSSTPSVSPTSSVTPTTSVTPSITPSPNPEICINWFFAVDSTHTLRSSAPSSNYGQTFKPPASGMLKSFSLQRQQNETWLVNATAYLFLGIATDPDTGITLRSFPVSMNSGGLQVFNFTPPVAVQNVRYTFLLEDAQGGNATMEISTMELDNQFLVFDEEIGSKTAIFGFCMVPDYMPTLDPLPSAGSSPTAFPSASSEVAHDNGSKNSFLDKQANLGIVVGAGLGGLLIVTCFASVIVLRRQRKSKPHEANIEMSPAPRPGTEMDTFESSSPYQPIGFSSSESSSKASIIFDARGSVLMNRRGSLDADSWTIPFKDLKTETEVGRGAFGVVYKGKWQGIQVAIKQFVLDKDEVSITKIKEFIAEAELMMKLKGHPNITQLLGICFEPLCLVTEFVENGSLRKFLSSDAPMDTEMQIQIARDIAAGMLYLHREGVIHRDLAARNILLDSKMRAKVSDFGMSRIVDTHSDVNKTGANIGPVRWMAPEAMRERLYNKKTDIWSFGVVVYEIITRKVPYSDADVINIATSVVLGERSLVPEIEKDQHMYPEVLVKIIQVCLKHSPQDRPLFDNIINVFDVASGWETIVMQ